MDLDIHKRRRSSSLMTVSGLSAREKFEAPDANSLTALLFDKKPARPHEVEFNSGESTPFAMSIPPQVEHRKSEARAARDNLAMVIGKSAADELRFSISSTNYWKMEAEHYAKS